ncbi:MAG: DUF1292 domain-containing protein [Candidatus Sericytochromatia bacterium]|nr:DUF1292 domain-containing protein [Candidatus Tanganyikabacteria bacterium]
MELEEDLGEEAENLITLQDEEGNEHEFAVVDIIAVDGREYALLMPNEESEDGEADDSVLVLRFEDDTLVMIEDEDEFNRVVAYLEEMGEEEEETHTPTRTPGK